MRSDRAGGQEQREGGQHGSREDRLHHDAPSLTPELPEQPRIGHRLHAPIGFARPARCQTHSGLAPCLEDPERAEGEGKEDEKTGTLGRAGEDQCGRERDPHQ